MNTVIEVNNVSKTFGKNTSLNQVLNGACMYVQEGEFVSLMGASGSGKSTLLYLIGGLDRDFEGSISLCGKEIGPLKDKELSDLRLKNIGFVFQFYNLIPNLTAYENVEMAAQLVKDPISCDLLMNEVGLSDRKNNFPAQLSGGEQQRVSIARAIAKNPKLLLCDEPTGALDYQTGKAILKLLQSLSTEKGMTVVIITHNSALTEMADRVIRVKNGKITSMIVNEHPVSVDTIEW
jgi:putative ABC transport system ATP-binding protein